MTHQGPSMSLRNSMAQSPTDRGHTGSHIVHKTQLPSFASFLSDTGLPDLNCTSTTSGSNGDVARPQLSHINHGVRLDPHIPLQATYTPSDAKILQQVVRCQSIPHSTGRPSHWPLI